MKQIKKDAKGKYYFVISAGVDELTGKRKQIKRTGFQDLNVAEKKYYELMSAVKSESLNQYSCRTLRSYSGEWLKSKKLDLSPSTFFKYRNVLNDYIYPLLENDKLKNIDAIKLQQFVYYLLEERKLSARTVVDVFYILAEVLAKAIRDKLLKPIFFKDVKLPKVQSNIRVWDQKEVEVFLDAPNRIIRLSRLFIGLELALRTGMRRGEVLALKWKDIDFAKDRIYVVRTVSVNEEGKYGLRDSVKTTSSRRMINMTSVLKESLLSWKKQIGQKIYGDKYLNEDLVVCSDYGNFVHPNNLYRAFKSISKKLDLLSIRLHDLRHTHATLLLKEEVNIKVIQERMGHKNIDILLNTYSHLVPSIQVKEADRSNKIF